MIKIKVPVNKRAQELMVWYKELSKNADELTRITLAEKLCREWEKENIDLVPPSVIKRRDYWYLIQLYSLGRHVNEDKSEYVFDLAKEEEIVLDDFGENNLIKLDSSIKSSYLLKSIFDYCGFPRVSEVSLMDFISKKGKNFLQAQGYDPKKYKLCPIPYDIYLRLAKKVGFGARNINTFFDGYRLRPNGEIRALFGGNNLFGGVSFIDSIWRSYKSMLIIPRLVIIRKDYGKNP